MDQIFFTGVSTVTGTRDFAIDAANTGGYLIGYHASISGDVGAIFRMYDGSSNRFFNLTFTAAEDMRGVGVAALDDFTNLLFRSQSDGAGGYDLIMTRVNILGFEVQAEVNLTSSNNIDDVEPVVVAQSSGTVAVASIRDDGATQRVQVMIIDPDGTVNSVRVLSPTSGSAVNMKMVELANGDLAVVWEDGTNGGVFVRVIDEDGNALTNRIAVHDSSDRAITTLPDIIATSDGGFAVSVALDLGSTSGADKVFYKIFDGSGNATSALLDAGVGLTIGSNNNTSTISELRDGLLLVGNGSTGRAIGEDGTVFNDFVQASEERITNLFSGDDIYFGSSGKDTVYGGSGSDQINGGAGNDFIHGGTSDPGATAGQGTQVLRGGDGNDVIRATGESQFFGDAGSDLLLGSNGDDTMFGGDGADIIRSRGGNDLVYGGEGNDNIRSNGGVDTIFGGNGFDVIRVSDDNDKNTELHGGGRDDTVVGGSGDDLIYGDNGSDVLEGSGGDDTLTGGNGADTFIYRFEPQIFDDNGDLQSGGIGDDVILDFENGIDRLRIDTVLASNFADLDFITVGDNVEIDFGTQGTLVLVDMAGDFNAADVIFF